MFLVIKTGSSNVNGMDMRSKMEPPHLIAIQPLVAVAKYTHLRHIFVGGLTGAKGREIQKMRGREFGVLLVVMGG